MSRASAAITVHGKDELPAHAAQEDGDVDEEEDALLELDLQGYDPTALPTNSSLRDLHIYEYNVVMTLSRVTSVPMSISAARESHGVIDASVSALWSAFADDMHLTAFRSPSSTATHTVCRCSTYAGGTHVEPFCQQRYCGTTCALRTHGHHQIQIPPAMTIG